MVNRVSSSCLHPRTLRNPLESSLLFRSVLIVYKFTSVVHPDDPDREPHLRFRVSKKFTGFISAFFFHDLQYPSATVFLDRCYLIILLPIAWKSNTLHHTFLVVCIQTADWSDRKAVDAGMQLRSKKERIEAFISRVNVDTQVTADWRRFVLEQEEAKQPVVYERKPVSQLPYPMAAEEAAPYRRTEKQDKAQ